MKKVVILCLFLLTFATAQAGMFAIARRTAPANNPPSFSVIDVGVSQWIDEPNEPFEPYFRVPTLKEMQDGWLLHYPVEYHVDVRDPNSGAFLYRSAHKIPPPIIRAPGGYTLDMLFKDSTGKELVLEASIKVKRYNWKEYAEYYKK